MPRRRGGGHSRWRTKFTLVRPVTSPAAIPFFSMPPKHRTQRAKRAGVPKLAAKKPAVPLQPATSRERGFPIVGIGASAGGLEALEEFFTHLPKDTGLNMVLLNFGGGTTGWRIHGDARPYLRTLCAENGIPFFCHAEERAVDEIVGMLGRPSSIPERPPPHATSGLCAQLQAASL